MNLQIKLFLKNLIRLLESEENIPQIPVNQTCKSFGSADQMAVFIILPGDYYICGNPFRLYLCLEKTGLFRGIFLTYCKHAYPMIR